MYYIMSVLLVIKVVQINECTKDRILLILLKEIKAWTLPFFIDIYCVSLTTGCIIN